MNRRFGIAMFACLALMLVNQASNAADVDLRGGWKVLRYVSKDGNEYRIDGQMIMTATEVTLTYWVLNAHGEVIRGVMTTGTYKLDGDRLTLANTFDMSAAFADDVPGFDPIPDRRSATLHGQQHPKIDNNTFELVGDTLRITFYNGQRLDLNRSSRPSAPSDSR